MNERNCESILIAKMAELDGEKTGVSAETVNLHFSNCENCRSEIDQVMNVGDLFANQRRRESNPNLWSAIEKRIAPKKTLTAKSFVFLGVFLIVYKLLEMLPERDFGFGFKLVPLIFVVALFVFIKENPFKINTELTLEN